MTQASLLARPLLRRCGYVVAPRDLVPVSRFYRPLVTCCDRQCRPRNKLLCIPDHLLSSFSLSSGLGGRSETPPASALMTLVPKPLWGTTTHHRGKRWEPYDDYEVLEVPTLRCKLTCITGSAAGMITLIIRDS